MNRAIQGLLLGAFLIGTTVLALGFALTWGPHQGVCKIAFPMIIGCTVANYEGLSSGLIAADAALFAGWLAWSAVQVQVSAEERRANAERESVEAIFHSEIDRLAEALSAVWRILDGYDEAENDQEINQRKLSGVSYGVEQITEPVRLTLNRKMVDALRWEDRIRYVEVFNALEGLGRFREVVASDVDTILWEVRNVGDLFQMVQPEVGQYFDGLWRRSPKAMTLGEMVHRQAGTETRG